MTKKSVIDKASQDKPDHKPLDPDQRAILFIRHGPTGFCICTRGWTLNEVLEIMDWSIDDVWATFRRTWSAGKGAYVSGAPFGFESGLAKLNEEGG